MEALFTSQSMGQNPRVFAPNPSAFSATSRNVQPHQYHANENFPHASLPAEKYFLIKFGTTYFL